MEQSKLMFYTMFHPLQGFEEIKLNKKGSIRLSILILAVWFLSAILDRKVTGFIFNTYQIDKLNILTLLPGTVVIFSIWVISNWGFCTLLDGEGSFKEIWIVSAYALVPYIIFSLATVFLSNFLTLEGGVFLTWIFQFGKYWSIILIFLGLYEMHQYTLKKTLWSIMLTILGILIIIFLALLVFSLYNQVIVFFRTIYSEIIFRL